MKRWFVKEKENVAKRRALEVQKMRSNLRRRWAQGPWEGSVLDRRDVLDIMHGRSRTTIS